MLHKQEQLPAWLDGLDLDLFMQNGQVKVAMPASSALLIFSSFFDKDKVAKQMKTIEGQADMLKNGINGVTLFGWVVDEDSGVFTKSNDFHATRQAYLDTVENDDEVVLFLEELTVELLNDPSSLTLLKKDGGLPSSNTEGIRLRNKNYRESVRPAFYVDGLKVGIQARVYAAVGVASKSNAVVKKLVALRGRWNGRRRVSDEINGHSVAYGY